VDVITFNITTGIKPITTRNNNRKQDNQMSDDNNNVSEQNDETPGQTYHWGKDVYGSKTVLETEIAKVLSEALADWKMATVKVGEKVLQVRVTATVLTGRGRPLGSRNAPKGTVRLTETHYVSEDANGAFAYHHVKTDRSAVVRLYGPFNTKAGAEYSASHGTATERPVAWEAPKQEEAPAAQ
jgi:hypothetical protein